MNKVYRYFRIWALMVLSAQLVVGIDADMAGHALFNAVRLHNIQDVRAAIQAGANVNMQDRSGNTALMCAVSEDLPLEVVNALIAAGADVNVQSRFGNTALMRAVMLDRPIEKVNALIAAGADVNVQNEDGLTALIRAVMSNRPIEIINTLIAAGADVNLQDRSSGFTALMLAVGDNLPSIEVVNALIAAGADVNVQNRFGNTALMHPMWYNRPIEIVNVLIAAGADVNAENQNGNTPLSSAKKNINTLMKLLQALCDNNKLYDQLYAISEDQSIVIAQVESIMQQVEQQAPESEQKQRILEELQGYLDSYSHGLK